MVDISNTKAVAVKVLGRTGLLLQKHSPEILMGLGIIGVVASTVMACKATLKVKEIIDEGDANLETMNEVLATHDNYSEEDYQKDKILVYSARVGNLIKLYGPSILVGTGAVVCLLGSHGIMTKRNLALVGAYNLIDKSFTSYRKRVADEFGEDKEKMLRFGLKEEQVTEIAVDDDGKKTKLKHSVIISDPNFNSDYARFFDEYSNQWSKSPNHNLYFLKCNQHYANDRLNSIGHIFLNEVYDMLGIPRSKEGAIVGWVQNAEGTNFVDFGIFDGENPRARAFVNGYEKSILLDFNITGIIYNLI
jgi:hypothetical protein